MIFMGVGAMTDFGPLIANPKSALLGGAAQLGIFFALFGALGLTAIFPDLGFGLKEASAIGIIGGADGPTAIWLTSRLAPNLLGAIAVAAYSYMALVPIIQPPIMKALTTGFGSAGYACGASPSDGFTSATTSTRRAGTPSVASESPKRWTPAPGSVRRKRNTRWCPSCGPALSFTVSRPSEPGSGSRGVSSPASSKAQPFGKPSNAKRRFAAGRVP